MTDRGKIWMKAGLCAVALLLAGGAAAAQTSGQNPPAPQQGDKDKPKQPGEVPALSLDGAPAAQPPVNAEEDGAFKAFQGEPPTDPKKKIDAGEAFLLKYPQSRYRVTVYSMLMPLYVQTNQVPKAIEVGDKELALVPNDVQMLASLSQTLSRSINKDTPEPAKQLAKAEQYGKKAIEIMPTITKPEALTEEQFVSAKNLGLSLAHSGLGVTYLRLAKYPEAIAELEQAVKLDPAPTADPVNYYVLGIANMNSSHFDEAAAAYTKCAALASSLQASCKASAEEAKKKSQTQLSAPK